MTKDIEFIRRAPPDEKIAPPEVPTPRPPDVYKSDLDVWLSFVFHSPPFYSGGGENDDLSVLETTAINSAKYADFMLKEYKKRKNNGEEY